MAEAGEVPEGDFVFFGEGADVALEFCGPFLALQTGSAFLERGAEGLG